MTESVRGDGGVAAQLGGQTVHVRLHPRVLQGGDVRQSEEADRWYDDKVNNRRPAELLPRDEVARAINSEIKAGRIPHR